MNLRKGPLHENNFSENLLNSEETQSFANQIRERIKDGTISKADEKTITQMIAGLGDSRGLLRRTFAQGLGKVGPGVSPQLSDALLNSENVILRRAAAKTLKLVGDPKALPALLDALINDEDPVVQFSAAGAMAIFGKLAVATLLSVLKNPRSSEMQCGLATWGLSFIGAEASEEIKNAARSDNEAIRSAAISALEEQIQIYKDQEAMDLLKKAFNDPSENVQIEAIRLSGNISKISNLVPYLIGKLNHEDSEIRKNVIITVMRWRLIEVLNTLKEMEKVEEIISVRNILRLAIKELSGK